MNKEEYTTLKTLVKNLSDSKTYDAILFINTASKLISQYEDEQRIKMVQDCLRVDNIYVEGCWTTRNELPFFVRKIPLSKIIVTNGDTVTVTYDIHIKIPEKNIQDFIAGGRISVHERNRIIRNMDNLIIETE